MSGHSRSCLSALVLIAGACATSPGPVTWLPTGPETQRSAFGAWVEVRRVGGDTMGGELIAASRDTLWIFHGRQLVPVSHQSVKSGRLIGWDAGASEVLGWTVLGTLSTISNGVFLIGTAPLWMIAGGVAGQTQAAKPVQEFAAGDWTMLAAWARFPQGLPKGLPLDSLKPKPLGRRGPPAPRR